MYTSKVRSLKVVDRDATKHLLVGYESKRMSTIPFTLIPGVSSSKVHISAPSRVRALIF